MTPTTAPTVLVVDDEAAIRQIARRVLEDVGYQITEASNGLEGVEILAQGGPFDLLLADLDMPVLGGDEMVRRIRTTRPGLKVLYVTAHIDSLMDTRPLRDGEAFLEKPFTGAGLREAVSLLLYGTLTKRN